MKHNYWSNSPWFSNLLRVCAIILLSLMLLAFVRQCMDCRQAQKVRALVNDRTGYDPTDDRERDIPNIIPPYDDDDTLSLPQRVLLEYLFPPIGDQGKFGTCVAWATGYNLKTALNAQQWQWSQQDLASLSNQTSPADVWWAIPSSEKGANCSGSGFDGVFRVLSDQGAASMAQAPYGQNFDPCGGNAQGDRSNRIASYATITGSSGSGIPTYGQIKAYIADSIPLVVGIRCGDNFMTWKGNGTLSNETFRYTGMHAYHAIALVGYDNDRHAFRLRNSWGEAWGDNGSIWVDYRLFCSQICIGVFVAKNNQSK